VYISRHFFHERCSKGLSSIAIQKKDGKPEKYTWSLYNFELYWWLALGQYGHEKEQGIQVLFMYQTQISYLNFFSDIHFNLIRTSSTSFLFAYSDISLSGKPYHARTHIICNSRRLCSSEYLKYATSNRIFIIEDITQPLLGWITEGNWYLAAK
jgi:hypothetical protein